MKANDPNNKVMNMMRNDSMDILTELQREEIWHSIHFKKQTAPDINTFLNSLSEDEFAEFIESKEMPQDKIEDTGRFSELSSVSPREMILQAREEQMMQEYQKHVEQQEVQEMVEMAEI